MIAPTILAFESSLFLLPRQVSVKKILKEKNMSVGLALLNLCNLRRGIDGMGI
jgi:hypothetical protein